jgi:hypothetical protein
MARPKTCLLPKRKTWHRDVSKARAAVKLCGQPDHYNGEICIPREFTPNGISFLFQGSLCSRPPDHTRTQRNLRPKATRMLPYRSF